MIQKVSHPSRVHLDIETDDLEAEVKRLEALGARRQGTQVFTPPMRRLEWHVDISITLNSA